MSRAALLLAVLLLAACGEGGGKPAVATPAAAITAPVRVTDAGQLARGAQIYKANCAVCHGANAEGAPNWQRPGPDGKYPAPPLDGSGHAWHHPKAALVQAIKEGTFRLGGSMPAWKDRLTDADIEAAIAWFQSRWPDEIYQNWLVMEEKARQGHAAH
ncbi:MAG: cytochrome c [Gammaproteobacteria bacterium]|nr:cytochrome c [Gammaproteobacteria bacterium]